MMRQPPHQPQRAEPLTLAVKGLRVVIPTAAIIAAALVLTPGLAYLVVPTAPPPVGPVPLPVPQVPLQASTWAPFHAIAVTRGALPDGVATQRKPPCDPDAEEAIGGWCWIPLNVEKCPVEKGKAFKHGGKCYIRALRAERSPTTGEVLVPGVANP